MQLAVFGPYTMMYFASYEELKRISRNFYKLNANDSLPFSAFLGITLVIC